MKINLKNLQEPFYAGSVQNIYFLEQYPEYMVCETTTGGSVFDVGTIFHIKDSDIFRAALRHKIYTSIEKKEEWKRLVGVEVENLETHHIGMIDAETGEVVKEDFPENISRFNLVKRYNVIKPKQIRFENLILWDYLEVYGKDKFVIPLENIVRLGITPSSSIYKKYLKLSDNEKKVFLKEYGVDFLEPWKFFNEPKVDFTTKYEPEDRALNYQEALHVSGLSGDFFIKLFNLTRLCAKFIKAFFKEIGLDLWDLKLEFAKHGDTLVLVDTIDTDSIRVTMDVDNNYVHFNKQAIRDYYIKFYPEWIEAINEAKDKSKSTGEPFQKYLYEKFPEVPEIDDEFMNLQRRKLEIIFEFITNKIDSKIAKEELLKVAKEEILKFR
jgi:phosphoribosylaminoimidazole-succinocarboxamide synthase